MTASYDSLAKPDTAKCARLNDDCRWGRGDRSNFRHMMTMGVVALLDDDADPVTQVMRRAQLHAAIRQYPFKEGDGSERDFGGRSMPTTANVNMDRQTPRTPASRCV